MRTYCITLQLNSLFGNYDVLYRAIQSSGTWWKLNNNVWMLRSNLNASQIRDYLRTYMHNGDRVFVVEVGHDWAGQGHQQNEYDWVRQNIAP